MLRELILVTLLLYCFLQPPNCIAQSSQALNNQGCDAMVNHDYGQAEELFTASYQEAAKARDSKRMRAALNNLKELYTSLGLDDEAKRIEEIAGQIEKTATLQASGGGTTGGGADSRQAGSISEGFNTDQLVRSYVRPNGTFVQPYHRTVSDSNPYNNYPTLGNINPYTGKPGLVNPEPDTLVFPKFERQLQQGSSFKHTIAALITASSYPPGSSSYTADLIKFGLSHKLDRSDCHEMISVVDDGGAIIELENGFVIQVPQDVDQDDWRIGDHVAVTEHPRLSSPFVSLLKQDGHALGGRIIATR